MNKLLTALIVTATLGLFSASTFAADADAPADKVVVTTHKTVRHVKHHARARHVKHHVRHTKHPIKHRAHRTSHATGDAVAK